MQQSVQTDSLIPVTPVAVRHYCPHCHRAPLAARHAAYHCGSCGRSYPVVNGVPILINDENSVFAVADYLDTCPVASNSKRSKATGLRAVYLRVAHAISEKKVMPTRFNMETALADAASSDRARVLVIGAGGARYSYPADIVYTDVAFSPGLKAIADGHDLPFGDAEFDLVISIALLEHVADPQRVVDEIWRVLKPRGRVFASTPFLQPVHMGAYDFTRFTYLGHRRLFRKFADLDSGMDLGPGAVMAWSMQSLLINLSARRTYRLMARFAGLLIAFPVKYLDYIVRKNPASIDGAGSVFFFGRKQENAISDRELIGLYRGGFNHRTASLYWVGQIGTE
jgi:SAM-dependent methyltransferase